MIFTPAALTRLSPFPGSLTQMDGATRFHLRW